MFRLMTAVLAVVAITSCGPGPTTGSCPNDVVPTCPATAPSFAGEVNAIVQSRCVACHAPGGLASNRAFTSYDDIQRQSGPMLNQLFNCRMPPADAPQPSDAEKQTLLEWLACGAPNN
jgi:uncharacterized membrane protein